ncbi:hypothetical protein AALO_G00120230 [Alosa alosa]|uniref:Uncharacterized protein n=1 Tax=Alosa alosa TaxID=278164 RepID=A0AAV6GN91_9TELE|nr:hypothetical protein AALO_G00120230 [Alosa alosa]
MGETLRHTRMEDTQTLPWDDMVPTRHPLLKKLEAEMQSGQGGSTKEAGPSSTRRRSTVSFHSHSEQRTEAALAFTSFHPPPSTRPAWSQCVQEVA